VLLIKLCNVTGDFSNKPQYSIDNYRILVNLIISLFSRICLQPRKFNNAKIACSIITNNSYMVILENLFTKATHPRKFPNTWYNTELTTLLYINILLTIILCIFKWFFCSLSQLLRNPQVLFAGYKVPHPLEHKFVLRIQTTPDYTPQEALTMAIQDLLTEVNIIETRFRVSTWIYRGEGQGRVIFKHFCEKKFSGGPYEELKLIQDKLSRLWKLSLSHILGYCMQGKLLWVL